LVTLDVNALLACATVSFGERQLLWKADCTLLAEAEARGPVATLWVNRVQTLQLLKSGAKREEWRCTFDATHGPHRSSKRRRRPKARKKAHEQRPPREDARGRPWSVERAHAGDVLWFAHKEERVAMLVEHVRIDKHTTVRKLMERRQCWAQVVPDASGLDEAVARYTEGCYATKGRRCGHVCARVYQLRVRPLRLSL
jgi:ASC-1-like (ASCH) protein